MRRTTIALAVLLLLAFGGLLLAADMALEPLRHDAELARRLHADLEKRGWLAEDTRVRASTVDGDDRRRLAGAGRGVAVDFSPSLDVLTTPGRLATVVRLVARQAAKRSHVPQVPWVEVVVVVADEVVLRTLVRRDMDTESGWAAPRPPVPVVWKPPPVEGPATR